VQERHQWIAEHFFLAKSQQQQVLPAKSLVTGVVFLLSQKDIPAYPPDLSCEQADENYQDQTE
jgi:hypothetical protein